MATLTVTNDTFSALRFNEALLDEINEAELSYILGRYPYGLEVLDNYKFLEKGQVEITILKHRDWDMEDSITKEVSLRLKWLEPNKLALIAFYSSKIGYFNEQQAEIKTNTFGNSYIKTSLGSLFFLKKFKAYKN